MPDYSQPGDDGGATPPGTEVDWTVPCGDLRFPRPLECNVIYLVTSTVEQSVETCAGVDFGPLWSRANTGRGGCRAPCVPWVTVHRSRWHCVGEIERKVEVNVYATVACRRP